MAKLSRTEAATAREETGDLFERLQRLAHECCQSFRQGEITPLANHQFEKDLKALFDQTARELLEHVYNGLEADDRKQVEPRLRYRKERYRINKKTKATIATTFGPTTLWSWLYLNDEAGEPGLHPLHVRLGIVAGATPLLAERAARWAVDHSQSEVRGLLKSEHGLTWSNTLLRKAQDEYWRLLRRMKNPRRPEQRLEWQWALDFFHVCGYVGKLADALFGRCLWERLIWFRRMRRWLRDRRQGVSNILRSAMQHLHRRKLSKAAKTEFGKAYRYLRRHNRWMDYASYRRRGLPIGSGVTEAACKTVFTQRLKRSGMRWQRESAQVIVDLRVLHLSGVWKEVVHRDLSRRALPEAAKKTSQRPKMRAIVKRAA